MNNMMGYMYEVFIYGDFCVPSHESRQDISEKSQLANYERFWNLSHEVKAS